MKLSNSQISICKITDSDLDDLVNLFERVWPDVSYNKREKAIYVLNEPGGFNYCAKVNDVIVGSRLSISENMNLSGTGIKCIQVCDTCTLQSYRGNGIMGMLNNALLKDFFENNEGQLIYNIGVPASRRVNEKYGWQYIESMQTIFKIAKPLHVLSKIGLNVQTLSGAIDWCDNNAVINIDKRLLDSREVWLKRNNVLHINYDDDTFKSRMKSKNGISIFSVNDLGSIVYKKGISKNLVFVIIGEVFIYEENKSLFKKLMRKFQEQVSPDVIKTAISVGHPLLPYYKSCGFLKYKTLHHGFRVESKALYSVCCMPEKWAIGNLDVDTF